MFLGMDSITLKLGSFVWRVGEHESHLGERCGIDKEAAISLITVTSYRKIR